MRKMDDSKCAAMKTMSRIADVNSYMKFNNATKTKDLDKSFFPFKQETIHEQKYNIYTWSLFLEILEI